MKVARRVGDIYIEPGMREINIRIVAENKTLCTAIYDDEILELIAAVATKALEVIRYKMDMLKKDIGHLSQAKKKYLAELQEGQWSEMYKEKLKDELQKTESLIEETEALIKNMELAEESLTKAVTSLNIQEDE